MPVYVYRNLRTGEKFEVEQRITEPALTEHPESGDPVKRLIQPVGIAFKGSGFYVTDSRGGSTSSAAKSSDAEAKSAGGSEAKAEKSSPAKSGSEKSGSDSTSGTSTAAKSKE